MSTTTMNVEPRIKDLHERAVRELVEAHRHRIDEPLVLAIRYKLDAPSDIYLIEVLNGFPGAADDELLETAFEPSASLIIVGRLHLALGSPAQVLSAIGRGDPILQAARGGRVEFDNGDSEAAAIREALGL
jgi:hypothetical protein